MLNLHKKISSYVGLMLTSVSVPSLKREEGQTLAEYALILAFVAIAAVLAVTFFGKQVTQVFSNIGNKFP